MNHILNVKSEQFGDFGELNSEAHCSDCRKQIQRLNDWFLPLFAMNELPTASPRDFQAVLITSLNLSSSYPPLKFSLSPASTPCEANSIPTSTSEPPHSTNSNTSLRSPPSGQMCAYLALGVNHIRQGKSVKKKGGMLELIYTSFAATAADVCRRRKVDSFMSLITIGAVEVVKPRLLQRTTECGGDLGRSNVWGSCK
jgi:hypothetical protein